MGEAFFTKFEAQLSRQARDLLPQTDKQVSQLTLD
jgi:hypothetical protein